jgi:hypothetical protein
MVMPLEMCKGTTTSFIGRGSPSMTKPTPMFVKISAAMVQCNTMATAL